MGYWDRMTDALSGEAGIGASLRYILLPSFMLASLSAFFLRLFATSLSFHQFVILLDGWFLVASSLLITSSISLSTALPHSIETRLVRWPLWALFQLFLLLGMLGITLVVSGFVRWRAIQIMSGLG